MQFESAKTNVKPIETNDIFMIIVTSRKQLKIKYKIPRVK